MQLQRDAAVRLNLGARFQVPRLKALQREGEEALAVKIQVGGLRRIPLDRYMVPGPDGEWRLDGRLERLAVPVEDRELKQLLRRRVFERHRVKLRLDVARLV